MRSLGQRLDNSVRSFGPGVITFILLLLSLASSKIIGLAHFFPLITAIAIYYWGLFAPRMLPYGLVMLLGLVQDVATGMPPGLSSLINLCFRMMVLSQRKVFFREAFWAVWLGFVMMSVLVSLGYWLAMTLYHHHAMSVVDGFIQWALTVSFYPLLHILFSKLYLLLPKD